MVYRGEFFSPVPVSVVPKRQYYEQKRRDTLHKERVRVDRLAVTMRE